MKRTDLMARLRRRGCRVLREGGRHAVVCHTETLRTSSVPLHREVGEWLARKVCRDLGIPEP